MGMPAPIYRLAFGAHSVRGFEQSVLRMAGFEPVRETLFGMIDASAEGRARMLEKMSALGRAGA
jgi:hypothetical protein